MESGGLDNRRFLRQSADRIRRVLNGECSRMNETLDQFQNSANYGYAHIETGTKGSFTVPTLTVELRFGETSEVAVIVSDGITRQNFSVERAEAERFLSKIIAAANKPEVLSKTYSMMQHFANAESRFYRGRAFRRNTGIFK